MKHSSLPPLLRRALPLLPALPLLLASCMSLQQDIVATTAQQGEGIERQRVEQRIAALDAQSFVNPAASREEACGALLLELDAALLDTGMQQAQRARLFALYGRVQLLAGKRTAAKESYNASLAASKGDAQTLILASRLGEKLSLEESEQLVSGASEKALLMLERALNGYVDGNYVHAVALFDSAFISLEGFYRDAYKPVRDRAWELRSLPPTQTTNSDVVALLQKSEITVSDAAYLVQANTQLLYPYTGGKAYTQAELYRRLVAADVFTAVSAQAPTPQAATTATRKLAARLLWHLYVAKKGANATMYSTLYRERSLASPVADVTADDADFDAILGCVEAELMSLVDGTNFQPEATVSGVDFNNWVSNIK